METLIAEKQTNLLLGIDNEVLNLDFERIKFKLLVKEDGEAWSKEKIDLAEIEYRKYLTLIKLYPKKSIVPSKLMDEFWHMHILDTKAYREDCNLIFGRFIDHFPYFGIYGEEDRQNLLEHFEETKSLYQKHFSRELPNANASRCADHACHVQSDCACRVEGACKSH